MHQSNMSNILKFLILAQKIQKYKIQSLDLCGGLISGQSGSIESLDYPLKYRPNSECTYRLEALQNDHVKIKIIDLELERDDKCSYDYLEIIVGFEAVSRVCGGGGAGGFLDSVSRSPGDPRIIEGIGPTSINFISDSFTEFKGFSLQFEIHKDPCSYMICYNGGVCDGIQEKCICDGVVWGGLYCNERVTSTSTLITTRTARGTSPTRSPTTSRMTLAMASDTSWTTAPSTMAKTTDNTTIFNIASSPLQQKLKKSQKPKFPVWKISLISFLVILKIIIILIIVRLVLIIKREIHLNQIMIKRNFQDKRTCKKSFLKRKTSGTGSTTLSNLSEFNSVFY